jgi:hypothetical protein
MGQKYKAPVDETENLYLRLSMEVDEALLRIWPRGLYPEDHERIEADAAEKRQLVEAWERVHGRLI